MAQDSTVVNKVFTGNGYLKNLQFFTVDGQFKNMIVGDLVHGRFNGKWKPSNFFNGALELRARLIWGDDTKKPGYSELLRNQNELLNLSTVSNIQDNLLLHTNIERFWLDYHRAKWSLRLGRQRINWGITTTWNPNDIFNTYNFLDFDYEEKPGSDALKWQYLLNDFNNLELAISASALNNKTIAAARYFFNKGGYDMQLIAGSYQGNFTTGFGWAGSLGNVGFKGETQLFIAKKDTGNFTGTIEFTHVLKKGWLISGSVLYNQNGMAKPIDDWTKIDFKISPTNLMPARWNIATGFSKEFTPLISANFTFVYSPKMDMIILFPSIKYNVASNLDADLVWQSFFYKASGNMQAVLHRANLRLKWNF
ncbi:MAG: hypothetical protein K2Q21_09005 [Chitinophagaceae bacterium]|nr:hypothetical protein [Chitinophagaceae bacterium]